MGKVFSGFDIHAREDIAVGHVEHGVELHAGTSDPAGYVEFHPGVERRRIEVVLIVFVVEVVVNPGSVACRCIPGLIWP